MTKLIAKIACAAALVLPGFASAAHGMNRFGDAQAAVQSKSPMAMTPSAVSPNEVIVGNAASNNESGHGAMVLAGLMLMITIARRRRKF